MQRHTVPAQLAELQTLLPVRDDREPEGDHHAPSTHSAQRRPTAALRTERTGHCGGRHAARTGRGVHEARAQLPVGRRAVQVELVGQLSERHPGADGVCERTRRPDRTGRTVERYQGLFR